MREPLFTTEKTTSAADAFRRLWITALKFMNELCTTRNHQANNMWTTSLTSLNSLCTTRLALSNNFVQLKQLVTSSVQSPGEQRVEQPVVKQVQQLSNKLPKVVHGPRTVLEQLLEMPHLFKTTHASSSALHPHCTSPKPLNQNSFSTLSTVY
jgi:hypothetical protein